MRYRKQLALRWIYAALALILANGAAATGLRPQDEKTERFQSVTLEGQVADKAPILDKLASGYSANRLCLVLFGDPREAEVQGHRRAASRMLKELAASGRNTALLHIDTATYPDGPKDMLWSNAGSFASPSLLLYVDSLQMSYHRAPSTEELERIRNELIRLEEEFMGRGSQLLAERKSKARNEQLAAAAKAIDAYTGKLESERQALQAEQGEARIAIAKLEAERETMQRAMSAIDAAIKSIAAGEMPGTGEARLKDPALEKLVREYETAHGIKINRADRRQVLPILRAGRAAQAKLVLDLQEQLAALGERLD